MKRFLSIFAGLGLGASTVMASSLTVPSGQSIALFETIEEPNVVRFRFLAPQIDPANTGLAYGDVEADFAALCQSVALPHVAGFDPRPEQIVISLMSAETEFGVANPDVTQFFEAFSVQDGACMWEQF